MGWIVWLFESALVFAASYAAAVAVYPDRGALERLVAALLLDTTIILVALHLTGFAHRLEPAPLAALATALSAVTWWAARRSTAPGVLERCARDDLRAPLRLARDAWREKELAVGTLVPAALALGTCVLMVYFYRSWTWDPAWYHVPETSLAIQERSLDWLDTPNIWTQGNPRNVEILAVWNCIFQHDNRLDDSSQLPFLLLGAAVVALWCRRVGASRPFAAAMGSTWVAMPPVFLQAYTTHVDVAWNAIFTAAVYYTTAKPERRDRWMMFLCWGLFLGTKYTALFHLALWAPWIVARAVVELRAATPGRRLWTVADIVASASLGPILGLWKHVQNYRHTGNPMFPFDLRIKSLGLHFPGPSNPGQEYGSGPDESPTFFGAPNALKDLVTSWYESNPFYSPDVRSGGFGPVFRWLLLFAVIALALDLLRGRNWRRGAVPMLLFVEALQVPVPYMTRFILSAGCAALVALAVVYAEIRPRLPRVIIAAALVALTWHGWREGHRGFIVHPRYWERVRSADPVERAAMQVDVFLWPTRWGLARERELRAGDVFVYDESVHFMQDLFNHDYATRVLYVSSADTNRFMARVRGLRARWVGVANGSASSRAVADAGGEFLFVAPFSNMAVYRLAPPRR
jgi:hypothetical protein